MAFIIFLFYANLLMGEFTRSHADRSLLEGLRDVVTPENFAIAVIASFIGHVFVEALRKRL